jgi:hypothetical protein
MQPASPGCGLFFQTNLPLMKIMKKNISALIVIFLISLTSVFAQNRETRNVDKFSKIAFRVPGKLYLRQGNTQKVEIEGDKNMLSIIETEVNGSSLVIHTPKKWNWRNDEKVTVYITVTDLEAVSVSGSGDVIGETLFKVSDIELNVSGSGGMNLEIAASGKVKADVSGSGNLQVKGTGRNFRSQLSGSGKVTMNMNISEDVVFSVSGSGKIDATGKAEEVKTTISGSGRVLASNLEAKRCEVRISGSGNVEINVKDELDASISGSGSVSYKGNPNKVNSNSSGSGRVSKM